MEVDCESCCPSSIVVVVGVAWRGGSFGERDQKVTLKKARAMTAGGTVNWEACGEPKYEYDSPNWSDIHLFVRRFQKRFRPSFKVTFHISTGPVHIVVIKRERVFFIAVRNCTQDITALMARSLEKARHNNDP